MQRGQGGYSFFVAVKWDMLKTKVVSELHSADKREVNPSSTKIFHILYISYVQSSVVAAEGDTAGTEVEGVTLHMSYAVLAVM